MQRKDLALRVLSTAAIMSIVTSIAAPAFADVYYIGKGSIDVEATTDADGKQYVTVGYIPTATNSSSNGELSLTAPTTPTKYMDYVFTQGSNHEWYLSALQESEMKPEATATPAPTANVPQDAQSMVEDQLGNAMADTSTVLNDDAASDTSAEEYTSADSEDAPAEDGGEDSADSESAAE